MIIIFRFPPPAPHHHHHHRRDRRRLRRDRLQEELLDDIRDPGNWLRDASPRSWVLQSFCGTRDGFRLQTISFSPDSDSYRRIGRGTRVPLQGAVDVVPLLGAIVGCHCSVLWLRGRVTTNFGGVDVVPLLGAIAGCHCSVLWWGDDQLWGSGRGWRPTLRERTWCHCWVQWTCCHCWVPLQGAIAGCHCRCHCSVLWLGGRVTTNLDVVPLLGATSSYFQGHQFHPDTRKQQWILSWASCKRYTVLYIDNTKIGFGYLGSMLVLLLLLPVVPHKAVAEVSRIGNV